MKSISSTFKALVVGGSIGSAYTLLGAQYFNFAEEPLKTCGDLTCASYLLGAPIFAATVLYVAMLSAAAKLLDRRNHPEERPSALCTPSK